MLKSDSIEAKYIMQKWKIFEQEACNYLNKKIRHEGVRFSLTGGSDSYSRDIEVFWKDKRLCSVECKYKKSQASQFVVIHDLQKKKFKWSSENKSTKEGALNVVKHMNKKYSYYSQVPKCKTNVELCIKTSFMYARVIKQINKKACFIVASNYENRFSPERPLILEATRNIKNIFNIKGKYRAKQSGSRSLPKKDFDKVLHCEVKDGRCHVYDPVGNLPSKNPGAESIYLGKPDNDGYREYRKLSNTRNPSVIFTLELKKNQRHTSLELLRKYVISNTSK
jgi:hypothetical protein